MRALIALTLAVTLPATLLAQDPATGTDPLAEFLWLNRPVVIFADTPNDPRFKRQMELLAADPEALAKRDVIILTDTDPAAKGPLRTRLRPRDFMLVLIAKDGKVALRKPTPWSIRELSRSIDKMPMRQDEIIERRGSAGE
jgi:uncharacterized protein DUF4174